MDPIKLYDETVTGHAVLKNDRYRTYRFYVITEGSHPSAFVTIPKGHLLYERNLFDFSQGNPLRRIECHGGISTAQHMLAFEKDFVIGWEYNLPTDYYLNAKCEEGERKKWTMDEIVAEIHSVIDNLIDEYGESGDKPKNAEMEKWMQNVFCQLEKK